MGKKRLIGALLSIIRAVMAIGLCVSLVGALLLSGLRVVFDREWYVSKTREPVFLEALQMDVQEYLVDECLFYGIPIETVESVVTTQSLKTAAEQRMGSVYDALQNGGEPTAVTLDATLFQTAIEAYFRTLPTEEQPLDPDAANTIAQDFAKGVASVLQLGITEKMVDMAHPLFAKNAVPDRVMNTAVWWIVVAVIFTALSLLPLGNTWRQRMYGTAGALFIGSALAAVPTWLFVRLDFPSQIALGESALREYVNLCLYTLLDRLQLITVTAFAVSGVLLIASIVWRVWPSNKA